MSNFVSDFITVSETRKRVKFNFRKNFSINNSISCFMEKTYDSLLYKLFWFSIYISSHFYYIYINEKYHNINAVIEQIMTYEIFWYLANILVVLFPYAINNFVNKKLIIPEYKSISFHSDKSKTINLFYILLAVVVIILYLYGLRTNADTGFFIYGWQYATVHLLFAIFFCGPSFFNMFYVSSSFLEELKRRFSVISSKEKLLEKAPELIYYFKNMTLFFGLGYFLYLIIAIVAFYSENIFEKFIDAIMTGNINYDVSMGMMYLILPVTIPIIYYLLTTRNIKRYLLESIIRAKNNDPFDAQDLELIQFIFYNRSSSFHLQGIFTYFTLPLLTSLIPITYEMIIQIIPT